VRWYVAYPLSMRHVERIDAGTWVSIDHSTVNRWVIKYRPALEDAFQPPQTARAGELADGRDVYKDQGGMALSVSAVDMQGQTIDFLLTEHRDQEAALRFLKKAIRRHSVPEKITIDGSEANEAASNTITRRTGRRSKSARSSISTIWWNKIIEVSSA